MYLVKIHSSFIAKAFGAKHGVLVSEKAISINAKNGISSSFSLEELIAFPQWKRHLFGATLWFYTRSGTIIIKHLQSAKVEAAFPKIVAHITPYLANSTHKTLQVFHQLAVEDYLRDSSVTTLSHQLNPLVKCYVREKIKWHKALDKKTIFQVEQLLQYVPIEQHVDQLRSNYEKATLVKRSVFYDRIESNPLTEEQRQAVVRNNDCNLVLAAAGTGKTSVIVAKVLDLIESGKAHSAEILVLAYNTAAAKELRERLAQRAQLAGLKIEAMPTIMTFHALGRMVLQQSEISTHLSVFVNEPLKREDWLSNWLTKCSQKDSKALEDVTLYLKCLQAIRTEQLNAEGILKRLSAAKIKHAKKKTAFLWEIAEAYRAELLRQNAIDFDDMITRATETLRSKAYTPSWKHILIDEFQDISGARMMLINALITFGPQPRLTAVGDDWQAIYRFAGGKLELTTQFDTLVGSNTKTLLQKTFRYNNSIAEVAGRFIMQNPEQFKKQVKTHHIVSEPHVYLLDSRTVKNENNIEHRALQVVNTIRKHDPSGSIAILARYRYLLSAAQNLIATKYVKNINYWTFHGAKGLEADYCILLGFFKGRVGFPNQSTEDALLEALLPTLDTFPHSEERRLFYVALTRAKKKSYIIADSVAPSVFVDELLAGKSTINVANTFCSK